MLSIKKISAVAVVITLAVMFAGGGLMAQEASGAKKDLAGQWRSFLHYIRMARTDVAESYGKAILESKPDPRELYRLSIKTAGSADTLTRALRTEKLKPIVEKINKLISEGAMAVRTDPAEIARWIKNLDSHLRARTIAVERLKNSGEYAVPQLVAILRNAKTSVSQRERVIDILPKLGRDAVRPLVAALVVTDPIVRLNICRALGKIGYPHAAAALKDVASEKDVPGRVRDAALGAVASCVGAKNVKKPTAELYYELAVKYYNRAESMQPDSRYDTANVWRWSVGAWRLQSA